jgi:predicted ferric reductase
MTVRLAAPPVAGRATDWRRDVVGTAAIGTVVAVLAMWLHGGNLAGLATEPATSLGRLTGLLAADLLLVQVFLMARIPWVERGFGQDRLTRAHRLAGFASCWLLLAHLVLITIGYAVTAHLNPAVQFWRLVRDYPGVLLALAGTVALFAVAVLSVRAARRKLRYESWHLLHLYAYLGVGLAVPHQLWTGAEFVSSPAARAYWYLLYGVCAGGVLLFRIGLPLHRNAVHQLRVTSVRRETPGVFSVYLSGRDLHRLPVVSGQYFAFRFLTGRGWMRAHPYSLSAAPHHKWLRITIRAGGDDARRIAMARRGTRVLIEGPYGRLTRTVRTRPGVLLMGAGIGITPLRALLEDLPFPPGGATLLYRANTATDFAFRAELEHIATGRGALVHYLDGPPPARPSWLPARYSRWSDVDLLRRLCPDVADRDVYLCGPAPWMAAARDAVRAAGVPATRIHHEDFGW